MVGCIVLAAYALVRRANASEVSLESAPVTTATTASLPDEPDRTEDFLDAYERSFAGPYAVTGSLEFSNEQAMTRQIVRRARIEGRSLEQIGGGAIVTSGGGLRRCSDDGTQFLCTDPEPEPTVQQRRSEMAAEIADGDGYRVAQANGAKANVTQETASCFVLIANGDGTFSPLGFESTYCFDDATGALSSKVTLKGRRTESFIATDISAEVTESDLTPM